MGRFTNIILIALIAFATIVAGCKKDEPIPGESTLPDTIITDSVVYDPTPYFLQIPEGFPEMEIPDDNPMTEEGVKLGRSLFYDPILSADNSISCASCHAQDRSFGDDKVTSQGIGGQTIRRHAPHLANIGWVEELFWDGRSGSLEDQALQPVVHPQEMGDKWKNVMQKITEHNEYPDLFYQAFGTYKIDSMHVVKAIAQFERTFISVNSKFDRFLRREVAFTEEEFHGYSIFSTERGDCFHCHTPGYINTDMEFHNNGLDSTYSVDKGRFEMTGNPADVGKFRTPSLRNIEFSGPYMHDGRFSTLREVIDFYSHGVKDSETVDPLMKNIDDGGVQLTEEEKDALIAFLKTLSDPEFINNENLSDPNN